VGDDVARFGEEPIDAGAARQRVVGGVIQHGGDNVPLRGTPLIASDSTSEPSVSTRVEAMLSGIAAFSLPETAAGAVNVGVSATGTTVIGTVTELEVAPFKSRRL